MQREKVTVVVRARPRMKRAKKIECARRYSTTMKRKGRKKHSPTRNRGTRAFRQWKFRKPPPPPPLLPSSASRCSSVCVCILPSGLTIVLVVLVIRSPFRMMVCVDVDVDVPPPKKLLPPLLILCVIMPPPFCPPNIIDSICIISSKRPPVHSEQ